MKKGEKMAPRATPRKPVCLCGRPATIKFRSIETCERCAKMDKERWAEERKLKVAGKPAYEAHLENRGIYEESV